jgi:hypothetical protein
MKLVLWYSGVNVSSAAHTYPATRRHTPEKLDPEFATSFIQNYSWKFHEEAKKGGSKMLTLDARWRSLMKRVSSVAEDVLPTAHCVPAEAMYVHRMPGVDGDPTVIVVWSR